MQKDPEFKLGITERKRLMKLVDSAAKNHPHKNDAVTPAVCALAVYTDPDMKEPAFEKIFYSHVPEPLKHHSIVSQFLDVEYRDTYEQMGDTPPPKMTQASPSIHSETAAAMAYIPELDTIRKSGKPYIIVMKVNQDPCPRCSANCTCGGADIVLKTRGEWGERREEYTDMTNTIFDKGQMLVIDVEDEREAITIPPRTHIPPEGFLYLDNVQNEEELAATVEEFLDSRETLNEYTDYTAFARHKTDPSIVALSHSTLPPGIDKETYFKTLKPLESKYSPVIPPGTSMLINLQREAINPADLEVRFDYIPCMRDIFNLLGAGVRDMTITVPEVLYNLINSNSPINARDFNHKKTGQPGQAFNKINALKQLKQDLGDILKFEILENLEPQPSKNLGAHHNGGAPLQQGIT